MTITVRVVNSAPSVTNLTVTPPTIYYPNDMNNIYLQFRVQDLDGNIESGYGGLQVRVTGTSILGGGQTFSYYAGDAGIAPSSKGPQYVGLNLNTYVKDFSPYFIAGNWGTLTFEVRVFDELGSSGYASDSVALDRVPVTITVTDEPYWVGPYGGYYYLIRGNWKQDFNCPGCGASSTTGLGVRAV